MTTYDITAAAAASVGYLAFGAAVAVFIISDQGIFRDDRDARTVALFATVAAWPAVLIALLGIALWRVAGAAMRLCRRSRKAKLPRAEVRR